MTTMAKVYVLTEGEYSDYHIVGIFSTREKADGVRDAILGAEPGHAAVEEVEIDVYDPERLRFRANVSMPAGQVYSVTVTAEPEHDFHAHNAHWCDVIVSAKSAEHAKKVIADRYREAKALGRLPKPR